MGLKVCKRKPEFNENVGVGRGRIKRDGGFAKVMLE